jgi:hypothetical protein
MLENLLDKSVVESMNSPEFTEWCQDRGPISIKALLRRSTGWGWNYLTRGLKLTEADVIRTLWQEESGIFVLNLLDQVWVDDHRVILACAEAFGDASWVDALFTLWSASRAASALDRAFVDDTYVASLILRASADIVVTVHALASVWSSPRISLALTGAIAARVGTSAPTTYNV